MKALVEYLRSKRSEVVKDVEVLEQVHDPTYGLQDPSLKVIEVIDFDALLKAIDDFTKEFES